MKPRFVDATLALGQRAAGVAQLITPWRWDYVFGGDRFAVHESRVAAVGPLTGQERWSAGAEGCFLQWLGAGEGIAYLQAFPLSQYGPDFRRPAELGVRRLDLASGNWLTPLPIPDGEMVVGLVTAGGAVFLVSAAVRADQAPPAPCTVRCCEAPSGRPVWAVDLPSVGLRAVPGAYLWGVRGPHYASSALQGLTWLGNNLLVCAGEREDLLCLDPGSGGEVWRVPRRWEFTRGFVGPSVWCHFMSRFGLDSFAEPRQIEDRQKELEERLVCAFVAGPIVVPCGTGWTGDPEYSVFLAMARGPRDSWFGYLSDCVVYELNEAGIPIALTSLPRMVSGGLWGSVEGGLVWPCDRGGLVRLGTSEYRHASGGMGLMGKYDMLCRVEWYRELRAPRYEAWLTAGVAGDLVAFGAGWAFRPLAGGYLLRREEKVYRFPITAIDLGTGLEQTLTLAVPFKDLVPEPTTNYSSSGDRYSMHGPHLLAITGLQVIGKALRVWLSLQDGAVTGLEFDLAQCLHGPEVV